MSAAPLKLVRRSDAEASRRRILEAARALFAEHGAEETTMAEVARRAGVARATVFNHFGSKRALVEGVTEAVYAGYEAILARALDDRAAPAPVLLRALFRVMGQGIEQDRHFYRAVFREIGRVNLGLEEGGVAAQAHQRALQGVTHLLTRGQARGELARALDPVVLATAFDSLVFGTITQWLYDDDASDPLTGRMLATADVFLGPVATSAASDYAGPEPDLWLEGDPGFGGAPGGEES